MKTALFAILMSFMSFTAQAQSPEAFKAATAKIGEHAPIFLFEKNENPENSMVIYTKLNAACELVPAENNKPVFEFYWLMNGSTYKPVHPLIQSNIRDRLAVSAIKDRHSFEIQMNDLKELKTDLGSATLTVVSSKTDEGCIAGAFFQLGPSDHNALIHLTSMYSNASKTLLPPFRKLKSIELRGIDAKTEKPVRRTYFAK